ncbi:hypothetical protein GGX14DRAFT_676004, partial [Mycena pura]
SSSVSILLQLPRELVFAIFDCLSEPELIKLYQVSSNMKDLAMLAICSRFGISEAQIQLGSTSLTVTCNVMRSIGVSRPKNLQFNEGDVDHLPVWRSLIHYAKRFPNFIPKIVLKFPKRELETLREPGLAIANHRYLQSGPLCLASALGATIPQNPILIINHLSIVSVRPHLVVERRRSQHPSCLRIIEKDKLTRRIHSTLAATLKHERISLIHAFAFPHPSAPLSSVVVFNPLSILFLDIATAAPASVSPAEWELVLPLLALPSLRTVRIQLDCPFDGLSSFLERHPRIKHIDFRKDWSVLCSGGGGGFPSLPYLKDIAASTRMIAAALQTLSSFPRLHSVSISAELNSGAVADFQAALRLIAARSTVKQLTIQIPPDVDPPWMHFNDAKATLPYIQKLKIAQWTCSADGDDFPPWLKKFPALEELEVCGDLFQASSTSKGPLLSKRLSEAISKTCPGVIIRQVQRFG